MEPITDERLAEMAEMWAKVTRPESAHAQDVISLIARIDQQDKRAKADAERIAELTRKPYQIRVTEWLLECFGYKISIDKTERNHRFLEEALELVQSCGCTADEAYQLVDYVYGRDIGERQQEVGGVMVTLAALCSANGEEMDICGETELARVWTKVEQIRAKQAAKPKHSPLPTALNKHTTPPTE